MSVFQFSTPDGRKFRVTAPDEATAIEAFHTNVMPLDGASPNGAAQQAPQPPEPADPRGAMSVDNAVRSVARGSPVGSFLDELNAATNATLAPAVEWALPRSESDIAQNGETWSERYAKSLEMQRAKDRAFDEQHPVASTALQVGGGIASVGGLARQGATLAGNMAGRGLLAQMGAGAAEGAGYGGLYGFGQGEGGLGNRVASAAGGAVAGGAIGGVLPAATKAVQVVGSPIASAIGARMNPAGYAAKKVASRLEADGKTPQQVASKIARAAANGDNVSLADVGGENIKGLARSAVNTPGPARERITTSARLQAMGQGDRITGAIDEAMKVPEGGYEAVKQKVVQARSSAAKPYYDAAYQQPVPYTFKLEEVLKTPAGRAALATAKTNSLNRREPWAQWFASVDDAGNIIDKRRVPDTRALDETQRVLRGIVESLKKPADGSPFGRALDTPQSIAARSVLDDLLSEIDKANPLFAKARSIGMDNIQADEALEFGRNALSTDSRIIARKMANPAQSPAKTGTAVVPSTGPAQAAKAPATPAGAFNDGQKQLARVGLAEAIRAKLGDAGFTHNGLLKFFSTREQVARIKPFFETEADWQSFRKSMFNEARKRSTYQAVTGNSTTARQLLDSQEAGQMGEVLRTGSDVATRGITQAAIGAISRGIQRLGGMTPEAADHIGRLLMTRDPKTVNNILLKIKSIEASQVSAEAKAARLRTLLADFAALQTSREVTAPPRSLEAAPRTMQIAR